MEIIWGDIVKWIIIVLLIVFFGWFIVNSIWKSIDPFLGWGDELTEDQEKVKLAAIETFDKFFKDLENCASTKAKGCICDISKIPEFPKDYRLILTKEKSGLKYSLVRIYNKKEIEITSKETINFGTLCYITDIEGNHEWVDNIVINFDKKPFYVEGYRIYRFYDELKPVYKKFDKSLCLLTDKMGLAGELGENVDVNPTSLKEGKVPFDVKEKWEKQIICK